MFRTRRSRALAHLRNGLLTLAAVGLVACSTASTTQSGAVGVKREQQFSSLVSAESLRKGAAEAYDEILAKARSEGKLDQNPERVARVRAITQRLIPVTQVFREDAPGWDWETHVITSDEVNAWAMPGGKIAVYSGIIEKLDLTDAELAAILGHEIAHALREHGRERASRAATQQLAIGVIGAATGVSQDVGKLANMALDVTFNLPNSRTQESEADRIGIELAARAGYDPHAAISLWRKMSERAGGSPPKFLSTHPPHDERISELTRYADVVMPLYREARNS
ncbi:MAG: M48 family metallopeptidase [Burkholderiaceae bacterium]